MSANAAVAHLAAAAARPAGVVNPLDAGQRIRALLFDLDGTLYDQRRMRTAMAAELLKFALRHPLQAPRTLRILRAFRRAQESLRHRPERLSADTQFDRAALACGSSRDEVRRVVTEWMQQRPLKHLRPVRADGLIELLSFLQGEGIALGVLSDYPASEKLEALGVAAYFPLVLCATDGDVLAFKPDPRGFLAAARRWQIDPSQILVVGDRIDADAAGAAAAGMPCVVIDPRERAGNRTAMILPSLERLHRALIHS